MVLLDYTFITMKPNNMQPSKPAPVVKPNFQHPQPQSSRPDADQIFEGDSLEDRIAALEGQLSGVMSKRINFNTDLIGLFETVPIVPTGTPTNPFGQVKIYVNDTTYRLYWYDAMANVWHYSVGV